jgi:chaperone required for assembly of F1-ATPase
MKRFYKAASAGEAAGEGGWKVLLDGKSVRTPAKAALVVPTRALAEAIAEEWTAQGETIKPAGMPLMRLACTAIDRVAPQMAAVIAEIAGFGRADLLCYRAEGPQELVERQARLWQPWLDWATERWGARLLTTRGVSPIEQPAEALVALRNAVSLYDPFRLTAVHGLVTGYGSLVLGLAVMNAALAPEAAWEAAQCDEAYQEERWGVDAEALARRRSLKADVDAALRFAALLKP